MVKEINTVMKNENILKLILEIFNLPKIPKMLANINLNNDNKVPNITAIIPVFEKVKNIRIKEIPI